MIQNIDTHYQSITADFFEKCKKIKLIAFDVDGVFSDGNIYMSNQGEELKAFNTKDGYGVKALSKCGVTVAVITGRKSNIVEQRMKDLNVKHLLQGRVDKHKAMTELLRITGYQSEQVASMGDDMPDLEMFALSSVKVAPKDAHPLVKRQANFVTSLAGGKGAVREICDLLIQAKGQLHSIHGASL